ncbi:hypothetical protein OKW39_000835 [Paraburkholderia sp. MM6662-R1]
MSVSMGREYFETVCHASKTRTMLCQATVRYTYA